jgi:ABC-2 type transport system permease protein
MSATSSPSADPAPLAAMRRPGLFAGPMKYAKILRISLMERLVYRADFFVATLFRFLPLLTTFLLWEAVFAGSGQHEIAGFTRNRMFAYLLLVQVSRMFSSMPGLAGGIARDIRDGNLKKYLLQPIDMLWYLLSYRGAHKLAYIATVALPYGLLFFLCRGVFESFPDWLTLLAYIAALLMSFLIGFFFEACIGLAGFWILEVSSLMYIVNIINFFVSGQLFPLDLLGERAVAVLRYLPFQYMAYFPAMVFLEMTQGPELIEGLVIELVWAVAFVLFARWLYRVGLRHYSAFGG